MESFISEKVKERVQDLIERELNSIAIQNMSSNQMHDLQNYGIDPMVVMTGVVIRKLVNKLGENYAVFEEAFKDFVGKNTSELHDHIG